MASSDSASRRGDAIVGELLRGTAPQDAGYELLREVFAGYPIANLAALLTSDRLDAVRVGAWLASELGASSSVLASSLSPHLQSNDPAIRVHAIESVMANASAYDDESLGAALCLIADDDVRVIKHAIRLLGVLSYEDLVRGGQTAIGCGADPTWLIDLGDNPATRKSEIAAGLSSQNELRRRHAAAALLRVVPLDLELMADAASSLDEAIRLFAELEIRVRHARQR